MKREELDAIRVAYRAGKVTLAHVNQLIQGMDQVLAMNQVLKDELKAIRETDHVKQAVSAINEVADLRLRNEELERKVQELDETNLALTKTARWSDLK